MFTSTPGSFWVSVLRTGEAEVQKEPQRHTSVSSARPKDDLARPRPEPARLARTGSFSGRPPKPLPGPRLLGPARGGGCDVALAPAATSPAASPSWEDPAHLDVACARALTLAAAHPGVSSASRLFGGARGWAKGRRDAGCSGSKMKDTGRREGLQSRAPQLP